MTKLTPERIRDAAEVLRQLDTARRPGDPEYSWAPCQVEKRANDLERELAETEAKRATRIFQFAAELYGLAGGSVPFSSITPLVRDRHIDIARELIDRYPTLAETPKQNACDCGNENDATWCDDECASRSASR